MSTNSPGNTASSAAFLHGSNALVFLLTAATSIMGAIIYYHLGYQHDLIFFDFEIKTGIYRTDSDLLWFCIEDWFIPMMIFLAYPILTTVLIHLPRFFLIESDLREVVFWGHTVLVFFGFQFLLSIS